jgi:hypothetical protein
MFVKCPKVKDLIDTASWGVTAELDEHIYVGYYLLHCKVCKCISLNDQVIIYEYRYFATNSRLGMGVGDDMEARLLCEYATSGE